MIFSENRVTLFRTILRLTTARSVPLLLTKGQLQAIGKANRARVPYFKLTGAPHAASCGPVPMRIESHLSDLTSRAAPRNIRGSHDECTRQDQCLSTAHWRRRQARLLGALA